MDILLTHTVGEMDATVFDIREVSSCIMENDSESFMCSTDVLVTCNDGINRGTMLY